MDRLFEDSFIPRTMSGFAGRGVDSNLYETPEGFVLQVPMPGVKPDDVELTVQQDTVTLKWETRTTIPEGATTHWIGFQHGQFQQTFTEFWTFIRRSDAKSTAGQTTLNPTCASCGAPLTIKDGKCAYCGAFARTSSSDWVVDTIEQQ